MPLSVYAEEFSPSFLANPGPDAVTNSTTTRQRRKPNSNSMKSVNQQMADLNVKTKKTSAVPSFAEVLAAAAPIPTEQPLSKSGYE